MNATYTVELNSSDATGYIPAFGLTAVTPFPSVIGYRLGPPLPNVIPEDEAFFWTPEWQAGEAAAEADLAAGRSRRFASADDLIRDLLRPK